MVQNAEEAGTINLLGEDELGVIVNKVEKQDRKSFSLVCKLWFKVEALNRTSLRLRRSTFLRQVLTRFPNIVRFQTSETLTEADFEFLGQTCPKLEVICLFTFAKPYIRYGRSGLVALANGCPKLAEVYLNGTFFITDSALASFVSLAHNLTHLNLSRCNVLQEDIAYEAIASSRSIICLGLSITDRGLEILANGACSKTLKTLLIDGITDVGVSHLQKMRCLEKLSLGSNITDIGGLAISAISTLKILRLEDPGVSDRTLFAVAKKCPNLEALSLSLYAGGVTGAGIRAFSSHLCLQTIELWTYDCEIALSDLDYLVRDCRSLKYIMVDEKWLAKVLPLMGENTRRLVGVVPQIM